MPPVGRGIAVAEEAKDCTGRSGAAGQTFLKRQNVQMNGREQRRRRWGAPRAMLLAGALLAARQVQRTPCANCERRDGQLDGPNAPGRAAREERAATSVRRVGGEATLRALPPLCRG